MFIYDLLKTALNFHEVTEVNYTDHIASAARSLTANKPRQQTARYILLATQTSSFFRLNLSG
jgi:hypothetical protein